MKRHIVTYIDRGKTKSKEIDAILSLDLPTEDGGRLEDIDKKVTALIRYCELLTDILLASNTISVEDLSALSHHRFLEDVAITDIISRNEE